DFHVTGVQTCALPISHGEGLRTARLLMVLSSISPLFILWAIRGNSLVPDRWLIGFCALMVVLPNVFLWLRIRVARQQADQRELRSEERRVGKEWRWRW